MYVPGTQSPNGSGITVPVATKAAAELPTYIAMTWISIDTVCHALDVLASTAKATGEKIEG